MLETVETLTFLVIVAVIAAASVRDRLSSDNQDPIADVHDQFAAGEIDELELERRLEFHVDDRNEKIRAVVEDVNGVGKATSKAIAREFDSLDALRAADQERLEDVHGVGERTAEAVLGRVRE
ncbi:helix-hairpin-helix domain-containing protein [Natrinema ejinorense]|uniref:Helix-hairpin-helix domain-containing protein n=1 Tax=Natrinema ejinorense TaxID=373386 RepID=A0A2A5QP97_9EURY|nr:helix-hairpin-helix domain-containing protein [Natrinema ejinorense]PCR88615.1 hypothetical protein CP557_21510 [Natrinema ejinorense]